MTIGCSKTSASIVARSSAPYVADVPADIAPRPGCAQEFRFERIDPQNLNTLQGEASQ
jgi:hypothetical protein